MKRILLVLNIVIFYSFIVLAQDYNYAWLTDIHIGFTGADEDLRAVVTDINSKPEIKFVIATGDITETGSDTDLEKAKEILDGLNVKYEIIPGNHDTKWSESGTNTFSNLWDDNKFMFEYEGTIHIGVNSGILWRGGGGHIEIDHIKWLEEQLKDAGEKEIYFYVHHPLDGDVDNWFRVTNLLAKNNIKAVFVGHGHTAKSMEFNGIPAAMGRSTLNKGKKSWGYNLVENTKDSIFIYEVDSNNNPKLFSTISKLKDTDAPQIDSAQFIKYSDTADILWEHELNNTLSASVLYDKGNIFSADIKGNVTCFNLDGSIKWQHNAGSAILSQPVRDNDLLAVATIDGDLISINANNGKVLQTIGIGAPLTSQLVKVDAVNNGSKAVGVVTGTAYGNLYCYDLYSFQPIWENNSAEGMIETKPLVIDNKLIYGSWDGYLYCVDGASGSLNWKWTENKNFYYSPAATPVVSDGKRIFVSTPDKNIAAVDLLRGTTEWRKNVGSWESIGISDDKEKVLVKGFQDKFIILEAVSGKVIKELDMEFGLDTMPIEPLSYKGNIIFGGKNGTVYLIDNNYEWQPLFFMGTARIHSVKHIDKNKFAVSNMDGKIVIFEVKGL